jgi:hypothetical protein
MSSDGYKYTHLKEEDVGDATQGISVYLDDLEALDYGMAYRLLGNPIGAWEIVG